jgi:hypothetical protein
MRIASLAIAALLALELHAPAFQESTGKFVLGVLRRDGIVTPFAMFDGDDWRVRWPADVRNRELPISLHGVPDNWWGLEPAPANMTVWRDGQRTGTVTLTAVTITPLMCQPRIVLKTDYKPATPTPPPFEKPYPKDGIVVAGDARVEPIESVEKGSADWNRVVILIRDEFNRQETVASRQFTDWSHPVKENQRKLLPIAIEALYRAPTKDAAWTAYFVEAVRQYPSRQEDRDACGLATYGSGWVLVSAKNEARVRLSAKVTYCDRKGVSYMLPFGVIRADGKVFWVFQFSGFEEEWYEVAEPTPRGVNSHVAFSAGGC